jgi:hypothetical protein
MYPPPAGTELTVDQARELDETFLSSDPFQYFRSRIASLMAWQETAPVGDRPLSEAARGSVRSEFNAYLQRSAVDGRYKELDVHAQVAADALAVRHHTAEALLRLACARLAPEPITGPRCLWAEIATGPRPIEDVITRLNDSANAPNPGERMLRVLIPSGALEAARSNVEIIDAANVYVDWLAYAVDLLGPGQIDTQAANNKVKHGLAVRARSDMRVAFVAQRPNDDGSMPLSAFTAGGAIDIFDQPVLESLAQGPRVGGHRQGLELTQLRLKTSAILAEAFMFAMTHGAMFHVAAAEHFVDRDDLEDGLGPPDFPGFPVGGPRPGNIDAEAPLGMRFPLTKPPGGGPVARQAGIGFRTYFQVLHIDYENRIRGQVVDDGGA